MNAASALRRPLGWPGTRVRISAARLAISVVALALAVRLIGLNARPLWLDEAYSAWFSSRGWSELWTVVPTYEPHPPFYYSLLKLWRDVFGGSAVALRLFSVLLSVLTVPVMLAAATELERHDKSGSANLRRGVVGMLAACSPMLLLLDQEARPYPLLIFAYAVATLGVLRLLRELAGGPGTWKSWSLLVAGTETVLWSHGLGVIYALCIAAALAPAWLKRLGEPGCLLRGAASASAIALLYLPCFMMMMSRAGDWGSGWLEWRPDMLLQLIGLYAIPWEAMTVASALAALVMVLLVKRAIETAVQARGWNGDRALMLLWWGPPVIAALVSAVAMPIFLPRTLAATLVPAYLAYAGAVARSSSQRERFAFAAVLAITLPVTALQVALRPPVEDWKAVAAYLDRNVRPGDQVWPYPNDSALPLREAGFRATSQMRGVPGDYPAVGFKGPIRAGSPAVISLTRDQSIQLVADPALRRAPAVWLVTRQATLFDPDSDVPHALIALRRAGPAQDWGYISVRPYYRR
jgi:hypothetical protein